MRSHEVFQAAFRAGVLGGDLPVGVTARDPAEAALRFDIYRNNVLHSLGRALASRYPVIERLVGEAFFAAMARAFVQAHPPQSPMLFAWGEEFPPFLETFAPVRGLTYLPDVARLEYARGRAYHAADARPLTPEALAALAASADQARLALHPSVSVLASSHAIYSIWAMNQPDSTPMPLDDHPETAAILRDRALEVQVWLLAAGEAVFLRALLEGHSLLAAAEAALKADPAFNPTTLLARMQAAGVIIASEETP